MNVAARQEGDRERLDVLIGRERDAKQRDRLRAARLALDGEQALEIATMTNRSRRFVQEWVYAYRDGGIEAIKPGKSSGRPTKLPREKEQAFKARMLGGVTEADGGVCTLRGVDAYSQERVWRALHAGRRVRPAAPPATLVPGPTPAAPQERSAGDATLARRCPLLSRG